MIHRRALHASPQSWIVPRYTSLDGLRGIAFLSVFALHYGAVLFPWQRQYPPLWIGVDLFFVLSGFLITGILSDAKADPHYFRNFYLRRSLRIFPLFYGFFLAILLLRPIFHFKADYSIGATVLYIENIWVKGFLLGRHGNPFLIWIPSMHLPIDLGALWSLCVEEQFYLIWPLVMWLMPSRRRAMQVCIGMTAAVLVLRTVVYVESSATELASRFLYYSTWSRCDTLFLGSALSLWLRERTLSQVELHTLAHRLLGGSFASLLLGFLIAGDRWPMTSTHPVFVTYGYTAIALGCVGVLLLALDPSSRLSGLLRSRSLASVGQISYGLYFFHGLPLPLMQRWNSEFFQPHHLSLLTAVIGFSGTWAAAWLSFHYYEAWFLRLKPRLTSAPIAKPRVAVYVTAAAGVTEAA